MSGLTVGSLFAGVGGFDLGLERAGHRVLWQVEIDPFCRAVLAKHWPDVPRYEDVKDVGAHNLESVDMLCAGFPCQPVSFAGKGLAQSDERWLWPEVARIVRELRPEYVLLENVPGLLVRGMGDVLRDLAALGYDAEWSVLSACSMGAPHVRRRVFIVAYPHGFHGRTRLRDSDARGFWAVQDLDRQAGPRARWRTRMENPSALYGGADGVPCGMDRNRAIGNAVLPDVAEWIGRRLPPNSRAPNP